MKTKLLTTLLNHPKQGSICLIAEKKRRPSWLTKAVFTLLCISFISLDSRAQDEREIPANGRTFQEIFDSLSTGLIRSRIPNGILFDRVVDWYGVTALEAGDEVTSDMLKQTWWDVEHADINEEPSRRFDAVQTRVSSECIQNKLPLLAISYAVALLDSPALEDGRLSVVDGILTDNNLPIIPYVRREINIAGIAAEKAEQDIDYILSFATDNILSNTSSGIIRVIITDITEENTTYTLTPGQELPLIFHTSGEHTLSIRIEKTDGTAYTVKQKFAVEEASPRGTGPCDAKHFIIGSNIAFQGYDETDATKSYGDFHIYYHYTSPTSNTCEEVIRKPIIIMDGFDPGDTRSYKDIYEKYLVDQNNVSLGEALRKKGYDIIVLNFPRLGAHLGNPDDGYYWIPASVDKEVSPGVFTPVYRINRDGGADFIERNAFVLVSLIQFVNIWKTGNEKLIVVGPSMGGQISRYALAYMEKKYAEGDASMNHNTKLWISFDSPHLGANVPMSLQQTLQFYGYSAGQWKAREKLETKLLSNAGKQLLIEQLSGLNNTASFRQTYLNNLNVNNGVPGSGGWPVSLRKIALVNGSGAGTKTHSEGLEILKLKAEGALGIDAVKFQANLMPASAASGQTFKGSFLNISILKLTGFFVSATYITYNPNPRGCMDVVPGGTHSVQDEVKDGFHEGLVADSRIKSIDWQTYVHKHTFVPVISSLAFKNVAFNWNNRVDDRQLVCNNETYFDNYYIPVANEQHVSLTDKSAAWVTQEIDYGTQGCPNVCSWVLNGPNTICVNTNTTYTLNAAPPSGATVVWSVSPGLIIDSQTSSSVTVRGPANTSGTWIKVVITPKLGGVKCAADVVIEKKNIFVGIYNPAPPMITLGSQPDPDSRMVTVTFPAPPAGTTYSWTVTKIITGTCTGCHTTGINAGSKGYKMYNDQKISYTLSATNTCGTAYIDRLYRLVVSGSSAYLVDLGMLPKTRTGEAETNDFDAGISVYPNPSDKEWMLSVKNLASGSTNVSLHDMAGKELMHISYDHLNGEFIPIGNSTLAPGMYLLYVEMEKKLYQYKLIKE